MNTLRVIFVHGISDVILDTDYTLGFSKMLIAELKKHGVIAPQASQAEIDQIITFKAVNYSAVGQPEEERVLAAYDKGRARLFNLADKLIETVLFDRLRRLLITSVSDVLVYESQRWRDKIRGLLVAEIQPFLNTNDAVTVIGHSLGSVVAFDTLYKNVQANPDWLKAKFMPTNLFTLGSPVALFSLEMDDQTGEQKERYQPPASDGLEAVAQMEQACFIRDGVWYNFLDAQDLIGYPLQELFEGKFEVRDILVQTGTQPIHAHTAYWTNHEVVQHIAERLKLDAERINPKPR